MKIFEDSTCLVAVGNVLFEGSTYFVRFSVVDPLLIIRTLTNAGIDQFVSWHPQNRVGTLKIINRVGLFKLFDETYDVRSRKFFENECGTRQFELLLNDLSVLSRQVLFSAVPAPGAGRADVTSIMYPSLLERFNYYRQTCIKTKARPGLARLVQLVLENPHSRLAHDVVRDDIWNAKNHSQRSLNSIFAPNQVFARLPQGHTLLVGRPGLRILGSSDGLYPLKALRSKGIPEFDTAENRFVKYVLEDIHSVCRSVIGASLVSGDLLRQGVEILGAVQSLLRERFFAKISTLTIFPFASPVLVQRPGYRDLYKLFLRSRNGAKHLFEDLAEESLFIELKDVSLLYEYWVFYKVATSLLKTGALFSARESVVKDGKVVNGGVVSDDKWEVHFNRAYSRKPGGTYSLRLRPDLVLVPKQVLGLGERAHVLDAKYKHISGAGEEGDELDAKAINAIVKPEDMHKMHCYVDAIEGVRSAVVVFPGSKFVFYPRDRTREIAREPKAVETIEGVGAVPLTPGASNTEFEEFISCLRKSGS